MAVSTVAGTFTQQAGTGSQSITGLGFQGKAILFHVIENLTGDGSSTAGAAACFGMATSSSSRAVTAYASNSDFSSNARADNTKCISVITTSGNAATVVAAADFVSFDSDGFTITWSTNDSVARTIQYWVVGGADITNVFIKEFTSKTSTGTQAETGVGFQPQGMIVMNAWETAPPANLNGFAQHGIGFASGASDEGAIWIDADSFGPAAEKIQHTGSLSVQSYGSLYLEGNLTSFDADGFTIDWTTSPGVGVYHWALCLRGGKYKVGSFNQATSAGSQSVTGVGFLPRGLFFNSWNNTSSASIVTTNARSSIGFVSGTSNRVCGWTGANSPSTDHNSNLVSNRVIQHLTEGTPTLNASADFTSFDSDGFTLSWASADATARQILYFAVGDTTTTSFDPSANTSWFRATVQPRALKPEVIGT